MTLSKIYSSSNSLLASLNARASAQRLSVPVQYPQSSTAQGIDEIVSTMIFQIASKVNHDEGLPPHTMTKEVEG